MCKLELSDDVEFGSAHYLIGEQAHIVAEHSDGPRGVSVLTLKERNSYHNLILLCPTHHAMVDKNEQDYPIEKLHVIKSQHELWVQQKLKPDAEQNKWTGLYVSDLI